MNRLFAFLIAFLLVFPALAQKTEIGGSFLTSHYYGSLSQNMSERKDFGDYLSHRMDLMRFGAGFHIRYNFADHWAVRAELNYGRIAGADSLAVDNPLKSRRNLSFRNDIIEVAGLIEYNFADFGWNIHKKAFTPYVFTGLSLFRHNPQAFYNNEWVDLQPLGTEGQDMFQYRDKVGYDLFQFAVPLGVGLRWALNSHWRLGVEAGWRFTFTQYLDDVGGTFADRDLLLRTKGPLAAALADRSAERNPLDAGYSEGEDRALSTTNDGFAFVGIQLSYVIWKIRCPKF